MFLSAVDADASREKDEDIYFESSGICHDELNIKARWLFDERES